MKTDVEFVNSEPYVTVYRGVRGEFDSKKASGSMRDLSFSHSAGIDEKEEDSLFGRYVFTSLSQKVAIGYMSRSLRFNTPRSLTLVKVRLPLKRAYIAKRPKGENGERLARDEYIPALTNRNYIWLKWRAWSRMRELELVWNIDELGGDLSNPIFQLKTIVVPVQPAANGRYESHQNWWAAQDEIRKRAAAGDFK